MLLNKTAYFYYHKVSQWEIFHCLLIQRYFKLLKVFFSLPRFHNCLLNNNGPCIIIIIMVILSEIVMRVVQFRSEQCSTDVSTMELENSNEWKLTNAAERKWSRMFSRWVSEVMRSCTMWSREVDPINTNWYIYINYPTRAISLHFPLVRDSLTSELSAFRSSVVDEFLCQIRFCFSLSLPLSLVSHNDTCSPAHCSAAQQLREIEKRSMQWHRTKEWRNKTKKSCVNQFAHSFTRKMNWNGGRPFIVSMHVQPHHTHTPSVLA